MSVDVRVACIRDRSAGLLRQMAELKLHCDQLHVSYPHEVKSFFDGTHALQLSEVEDIVRVAAEIDLKELLLVRAIDDCTSGDVEYDNGMVIDLVKLPSDVKKLRIYME